MTTKICKKAINCLSTINRITSLTIINNMMTTTIIKIQDNDHLEDYYQPDDHNQHDAQFSVVDPDE